MAFNISYFFQAKDHFTSQLKKMNSELVKVAKNTRNLNKEFKKLERVQAKAFSNKRIAQIDKWGRKLKKVGSKMSKFVSLPIGGAFTAGLIQASKFEAKLNSLGALVKGDTEGLKRMRDAALSLSGVFSPTDIVDAQLQLKKHGLDATQVIAALPGVLNLAASAHIELGTAARDVTNIMFSFGLEAESTLESVNTLTHAFLNSATTLPELAQAIKFVGPAAHSLGLDLKQTTAALMAMSQGGKFAGIAGRNLRILFFRLSKISDKLQAKFKTMGIEAFDANGNITNLGEALKGIALLDERAKKRGIRKRFLEDVTGGSTQIKAALLSFLNLDKALYSNLLKQLSSKEDISRKMADAQLKGVIGARKKLQASLNLLSISVFDPEVLNTIATAISKLALSIVSLSKDHPFLRKILIWTAAILFILGPILKMLGTMLILIKLMGGTPLVSLGKGLAGIAGWLRKIGGLFGLVRAAGLAFTSAMSIGIGTMLIGTREFIRRWTAFKALFKSIVDAPKQFAQNIKIVATHPKDFFNYMTEGVDVKQNIRSMFDFIPGVTKSVTPSESPSAALKGSAEVNVNFGGDTSNIQSVDTENNSNVRLNTGDYMSGGFATEGV